MCLQSCSSVPSKSFVDKMTEFGIDLSLISKFPEKIKASITLKSLLSVVASIRSSNNLPRIQVGFTRDPQVEKVVEEEFTELKTLQEQLRSNGLLDFDEVSQQSEMKELGKDQKSSEFLAVLGKDLLEKHTQVQLNKSNIFFFFELTPFENREFSSHKLLK